MASAKPVESAKVVFADHNIAVHADGTWVAKVSGTWGVDVGAKVFAQGAGDAMAFAGVTAHWLVPRCKLSRVVAPDGTHYDVRKLAGLA